MSEKIRAADMPATRAEQYRTIYVNHATAGHTAWELHFSFGTVVEKAPGQPVVEEQLMLMMTLPFAKAVVASMQKTIASFESHESSPKSPEIPEEAKGS